MYYIIIIIIIIITVVFWRSVAELTAQAAATENRRCKRNWKTENTLLPCEDV